MRKFRYFIPALGFMLLATITGCNSKAKSWSQEQKETWTTSCMKFMNDRGVAKKDAASFCDCMLKKTANKYTPEEAVKITPEEERQLWQQCDYQW
ncbi:MAG: hypothetical protein NT004_03675 [Bacteroidetes bacterium]|nr:hypothetical protein [Bacteroidota bacterium]